jgi:hypothetical protein
MQPTRQPAHAVPSSMQVQPTQLFEKGALFEPSLHRTEHHIEDGFLSQSAASFDPCGSNNVSPANAVLQKKIAEQFKIVPQTICALPRLVQVRIGIYLDSLSAFRYLRTTKQFALDESFVVSILKNRDGFMSKIVQRQIGGTLTIDTSLQGFMGKKGVYESLKHLHLTSEPNAIDLAHIRESHPMIESMRFSNALICEELIDKFKKFQNLQSLDLRKTAMTKNVLRHLLGLQKLCRLYIACTYETSKLLKRYLKRFTALEQLYLYEHELLDMKSLQSTSPNIKIFLCNSKK